MNKGFTFYFVAGKYGGFGVKIDGSYLRITLGFIAFGFGFADMERDVADLVKYATEDREELRRLQNEFDELRFKNG